MKSIEYFGRYIMGDTTISQSSISKARFTFGKTFGRHPVELRAGCSAIRTMLVELDQDKRPVIFNRETVQGLKIVEDYSLQPDDWLVGSVKEVIKDTF